MSYEIGYYDKAMKKYTQRHTLLIKGDNKSLKINKGR